MNVPSWTPEKDWDERNAVEIRRFSSSSDIDHESSEPYEFVVPARSGGPLDIVGLYVPRASKTLIVSFHGSLQRSKYQLPRFEWRKTLRPLDAAQLFIADSSLHLNKGMALAWYVGNAEQDLTADLANLIREIAATAGYERILLTGSSGGGFASLAISRRIKGSLAVCFSPQTRVGDYAAPAVGTFCNVSFPEVKGYPNIEGKYRSRLDLRHLYATTPNHNFVRYVQNTRDVSHFRKHYTPFAEALGVDPALGGFDETGRMELLPERLQEGHVPPSRGRFLGHILEAHSVFFGCDLEVMTDEETAGLQRRTASPKRRPDQEEKVMYSDEFSHGYLLTNAARPQGCDGWREAAVGPLTLHLHTKTAHALAGSADEKTAIVLVGQPVDVEKGSIDAGSIAESCLSILESEGAEAAIRYVAYLGGRFVAFLLVQGQLIAVPDCHATQAAYWAISAGEVCIASHTALVGETLRLEPDHDAIELLTQLKTLKPRGTRYYPGVRTSVTGVRPIIANCLLTVDLDEVRALHLRFYPFSDIPAATSTQAAFDRFESYFLAHVGLLAKFGTTGISLTGGKDSRATLLAALASGSQDIFSFTYYQYLNPSMGADDMYAANELAFRAGIRHRILKWAPQQRSQAFDAMFLRSWPDGGQARPVARSMYEELPHGFYELQSTIAETGTMFYPGRKEKNISATRLTALWQGTAVSQLSEFTREFEEYIQYSQFAADELRNINYHDAFYWEHRNTCWAANRYHEGDLGHRVLLPFNHRGLIETMLSLPTKERRSAVLLDMFAAKYGLPSMHPTSAAEPGSRDTDTALAPR